jgi:cytochrome c55X
MDCARCHGRNHDGLAAPSVLEFVRTQDRARFERIVLDGDPMRGMPGYRQIPRVAENIASIYRYFVLRANGIIARGEPFAPPPTIQDQPIASEN